MLWKAKIEKLQNSSHVHNVCPARAAICPYQIQIAHQDCLKFRQVPSGVVVMAGTGWQFSVTIPSWTQTTLEGDDLVVVRDLVHLHFAPDVLSLLHALQQISRRCLQLFMHHHMLVLSATDATAMLP